MYCKYCGQQIDDDSAFCSKCGRSVTNNSNSTPGVSYKAVPKRAKTSSGKVAKGSGIKNAIYLILAIVCVVPIFYAEYRRLILEVPLDVYYWLLVAPAVLSVFFLYRIIGAPVVAEEKRKQAEAIARGEEYSFKGGGATELVCELLSTCLFIVAIVAFAASGIIQLIF